MHHSSWSLHMAYTIQAWHSLLLRLSSLRISPESCPSEISGRKMVEVVTCTIDVNIADNTDQYQPFHMGNYACMSCSVQKLCGACCRAFLARGIRGVDHCWISNR